MNVYYVAVLIICAAISIIWRTNSQKIHYATRLSNFTITSETNSMYVVSMKIYQRKMEHRVATTFNVTRDINIKNVEVVFHRCVPERSACEYFQNWTFPGNTIKRMANMKNQFWTPIFSYVTPKFTTLPLLKADIYTIPNMTADGDAAVLYYPDVIKYIWSVDVVLNDEKNKIAGTFTLAGTVHTFVDRKIKY